MTVKSPEQPLGKRIRRRLRVGRRAVREHLLVRPGFSAAAWLLPRLSRPAILRLSRGLAAAGMRFAKRERRIAEENLDVVFGDEKTAAEKATILRDSFRTMSLTMLDVFWFSRDTAARLERYAAYDSKFDAALEQHPTLFVTAHFGNWEALGLSVAHKGHPITSVAKPLNSHWVNERFVGWRSGTGQNIVPVSGAMRGLMNAFKNNHHVAILLDQNTFADQGGVMVNFFDRLVPVAAAAAQLAIRFDTTIKTAFSWSDPDGVYHATTFPVEPSDDPLILTQAFTTELEAQIRERPGSWLWMYKRWRIVPEGDDPARYPSYAKPE